MGDSEPIEIARTSRARVPNERLRTALLLAPLAFNVLHALVMIAVYRDTAERRSFNVLRSLVMIAMQRDTADMHLQIWLLASGLTLLAQLDLLLRHRRKRARPSGVGDGNSTRLRIADFVVLVLAFGICAMQAGFLGFALSSSAFGPQHTVGFASTTGNWGRLLWAYYALAATPLAYLQTLALIPWRSASLLERGVLASKKARWLLGSYLGLSVVTLVLSELVVYFL